MEAEEIYQTFLQLQSLITEARRFDSLVATYRKEIENSFIERGEEHYCFAPNQITNDTFALLESASLTFFDACSLKLICTIRELPPLIIAPVPPHIVAFNELRGRSEPIPKTWLDYAEELCKVRKYLPELSIKLSLDKRENNYYRTFHSVFRQPCFFEYEERVGELLQHFERRYEAVIHEQEAKRLQIFKREPNVPERSLDQLQLKPIKTSHEIESNYSVPANYQRDKWIFEQRKASKTWPQIMEQFNQIAVEHDWNALESVSGFRNALKSICLYHGWDVPEVKNGRPKTLQSDNE